MLTENGPGFWHFGFFSLTNGLPAETVDGHESIWVSKFMDWLTVQRGAITQQDADVSACFLRDDAHLRASFEWFRAFPQNKDVAELGRQRPTMPVLAVGADHILGRSVGTQVEQCAVDVTIAVVPDSGHWT